MPKEIKHSDEKIISEVEKSTSLRDAGRRLGMSDTGVSYRLSRMKKIVRLKTGKIVAKE